MHDHIKIYSGKVPFNTGKSKMDALVPWNKEWSVFEACETLFNPEKRRNDMMGANTVTRLVQIPKGYVSRKFDDEPYIVPFIADGSKKSVLICPGGAYYDVSLDNEGYPTAEFLQKNGISAFVLKYRVWPYKYPAAYCDCRRAICYIKHNADLFGIDPDKLSVIGFSAGGNLAVATPFLFSKLPNIDGYVPDDIDKEDTSLMSIGAIYPELCADKFLMSMQFGDEIHTDADFCKRVLRKMYLPRYVKSSSAPMFLCGCVDDGVVSPTNILEMATAYQKVGVPYEVHMFREGGHGFGVTQEDIPPMYGHPPFDMRGTKEWIRLYITWLEKTEDKIGK